MTCTKQFVKAKIGVNKTKCTCDTLTAMFFKIKINWMNLSTIKWLIFNNIWVVTSLHQIYKQHFL